MKQKTFCLFLAFLLAFFALPTLAVSVVYQGKPLADEGAPTLLDGASVRASGGIALRFDAVVQSPEQGAEYGVMLVPSAELLQIADHTYEAIVTALGTDGFYDITDDRLAPNTDGTYTVSVVLDEIPLDRAQVIYVAIPYVKKGEMRAYGAFNFENNARSAAGVATKALADLKGEPDERFLHASALAELARTTESTYTFAQKTLYSCYTGAQQTALLAYLTDEAKKEAFQLAELSFGANTPSKPNWSYPY